MKLIFVGVPGVTVTLPTPVSIGFKPGDAVTVFSSDPAGATVVPGAGASLKYDGVNSATSTVLKQGQYSAFVAATDASWQLINSTSEFSRNPDFASQKAASGYQKLPGGLIIQWGIGVTDAAGNASVSFPMAFPNAAAICIPQERAANSWPTNGYASVGSYGLTVAGCSVAGRATSGGAVQPSFVSFSYVAIGY